MTGSDEVEEGLRSAAQARHEARRDRTEATAGLSSGSDTRTASR